MGSFEPVVAALYGSNAAPFLPGGVLQVGVGVAAVAHRHVWLLVRLAAGEPHLHFRVGSLPAGSFLLSQNSEGHF